jgi:SAM-dependent methyltransferase
VPVDRPEVSPPSTEVPSGVDELFDQPALWRAEVIDRHVPGPLHAIAASAAPGFPQLMPMLTRAADHSPTGPCLDVGAGLGGISTMWATASARDVIAVDPGQGSTLGARRLFDSLSVVQGSGHALPVRSASIAAAVLIGVTSLLEDVEVLASELARVLLVGGRVCIVDPVANGHDEVIAPPNWFRPLESIECMMGSRYEVAERALADPSVGSWAEVGGYVAARVEAEHDGEPAFDMWRTDQHHLAEMIESGEVLVGATVLTLRS